MPSAALARQSPSEIHFQNGIGWQLAKHRQQQPRTRRSRPTAPSRNRIQEVSHATLAYRLDLRQENTMPDATDTSATDYDTDMQTIQNYVQAVVEAKAKIATVHLSAIDNFQTTVQSASPAEAKPDFLTVVLKAGLKMAEKAAVSAVKDATGADLGPLVDLMHGISDEIDRAAKAAQNLAVADWIKTVRTAVTNAYAQDQTGSALRKTIEDAYKQNDEGGRGGYIGGIQNELTAMQTVLPPKTELLETAMYTTWISQNFNNDCIDGTGIIYVQFADDSTFSSATVLAPLGDKIAGALNRVMTGAGKNQLMDLDVVKKVCKGNDCMCFEGNNVVRKAASSDDTQTFLSSADTWKLATLFSTPA